jgi:hypothetical protein
MWWIRRRCTWNRHAKLDDPVFWPIVNHDNPDPADRPESSSLPTSTFSGANTPSTADAVDCGVLLEQCLPAGG